MKCFSSETARHSFMKKCSSGIELAFPSTLPPFCCLEGRQQIKQCCTSPRLSAPGSSQTKGCFPGNSSSSSRVILPVLPGNKFLLSAVTFWHADETPLAAVISAAGEWHRSQASLQVAAICLHTPGGFCWAWFHPLGFFTALTNVQRDAETRGSAFSQRLLNTLLLCGSNLT